MDPNKVLVNLFCIILMQKLNFDSDKNILIFSQSNVNITIDTKLHLITSLYISNQTKLINSSNGKNNQKDLAHLILVLCK